MLGRLVLRVLNRANSFDPDKACLQGFTSLGASEKTISSGNSMSGLHCAGKRRHARAAIEKEIRCSVAATLAEFGNLRGKSCAAITARM